MFIFQMGFQKMEVHFVGEATALLAKNKEMLFFAVDDGCPTLERFTGTFRLMADHLRDI